MTGGCGPIAVTGARGFVGTRLVARLVEQGRPVVAILRPGRDLSPLAGSGIEVRYADLAEPAALNGVFNEVEAVVHLSGLAQVAGLVPELERAGVGRGVFVSSAGVYTRLASPSADRKREGERALRESALGFTILRPSMIYGAAGDRNLARLVRLIRRYGVVPVPGGGATLQQPVHVDDLVETILEALDSPLAARREYDLGGPVALSLLEVIQLTAGALDRPVRTIPLPIEPAARLIELARGLRIPCPLRPEQVLRLRESKAVDISTAVRDLGFRPRPFADGIRTEVSEILTLESSALDSPE